MSPTRREVVKMLALSFTGVVLSPLATACSSSESSKASENYGLAQTLKNEMVLPSSSNFADMLPDLYQMQWGKRVNWGRNTHFGNLTTSQGKILPIVTNAKGEPIIPDTKVDFVSYPLPLEFKPGVTSKEIIDGKNKLVILGTLGTVGRIGKRENEATWKKFMAEYFKESKASTGNALILNFLPAGHKFTYEAAKDAEVPFNPGDAAATADVFREKVGDNTGIVRANVTSLNLNKLDYAAGLNGLSLEEILAVALVNEKVNWAVDNYIPVDDKGVANIDGIPLGHNSPHSEVPSTLMGYLALADPTYATLTLGSSYAEIVKIVVGEMKILKEPKRKTNTDAQADTAITRRQFLLFPFMAAADRALNASAYLPLFNAAPIRTSREIVPEKQSIIIYSYASLGGKQEQLPLAV